MCYPYTSSLIIFVHVRLRTEVLHTWRLTWKGVWNLGLQTIPVGLHFISLRSRFATCTYQNETDCLYLLVLDISYKQESKQLPLQHPWATVLLYKQKTKWPCEKNEQDIECPITSWIFVKESQSLCLYPGLQGQWSQFFHLLCNWRYFILFFKLPMSQISKIFNMT